MIFFLEQLLVYSCYTDNNTVRLEGVIMWLVTYFQYPHYKCIVTQNAQRKWVHF